MRQHRNDTVHKIDACPARKRFDIQCRMLLHIIADICNMHAQPVMLPFHGQGNRVVQVFGILAVYGDHLPVPEVPASLHIRFADLLCHIGCLIQDFL